MLEIAASVLSNSLIICYFAYLLPPRYSNKLLLAIPISAMFAADIFGAYLNGGVVIGNIINITMYFVCLYFFQSKMAGFFYITILQFMLLFSDGFVYFALIMVCNLRGINFEDIPNHKVFLHLLLIALWAVLIFFCARKFKVLQKYDIPKTYWLYFSAIPICSIYLLFLTYELFGFYSKVHFDFLMTLIVIAAINIVNIYLYSTAISYYATKLANQTLMERVNSFARKQNDLVEAYKNLRTMQHGIKNDLMPVLTAINENQYAAADEKIREMIGAADLDTFVSNTGINFIDDMINYKAALAREKNIEINVVSELKEELNLNYLDISSIIGTALDNAVEACLQMEKDRIVDICVTSGVGLFMVKISNPRSGDIHSDGAGGFLSTKPDGAEHGFGLVSIKKLVEKNEGVLRIEYPAGRFELSVVFNEVFS